MTAEVRGTELPIGSGRELGQRVALAGSERTARAALPACAGRDRGTAVVEDPDPALVARPG
jgi:hypothetical protein